MSEYIVEMKHITKRFPGIVANDDVTIQIKKGEIFALLGENGAGKSTLMSMLFGMYEPDEGEIYIRGEKVKLESPNHATKLNIGMVHQHFKLVSNYTIAENIANVNTTRTEDGTGEEGAGMYSGSGYEESQSGYPRTFGEIRTGSESYRRDQ